MIASQKNHVLGVVYLDSQEKNENLEAVDASIDVIAEEQIVNVRWRTGLLKHVAQIVILTMDISDYDNGLADLAEVRLLFYPIL